MISKPRSSNSVHLSDTAYIYYYTSDQWLSHKFCRTCQNSTCYCEYINSALGVWYCGEPRKLPDRSRANSFAFQVNAVSACYVVYHKYSPEMQTEMGIFRYVAENVLDMTRPPFSGRQRAVGREGDESYTRRDRMPREDTPRRSRILLSTGVWL